MNAVAAEGEGVRSGLAYSIELSVFAHADIRHRRRAAIRADAVEVADNRHGRREVRGIQLIKGLVRMSVEQRLGGSRVDAWHDATCVAQQHPARPARAAVTFVGRCAANGAARSAIFSRRVES